MRDNLHSEKEILIFNGVIKLINQGINLHSIKVADIAKEVGIGKGTVYEYFKSKDEILEKSLLYSMNLCMNKSIEKINNSNGFKNKMYTILEITKSNVKEYNSSNGLIFSNMETYEFTCLINSNNKQLKDMENSINKTIEDIILLGIKEKVIQDQNDREYEKMAIKSVIIGFANAFYCSKFILEEEIDKLKDRSYKLLIKGLN